MHTLKLDVSTNIITLGNTKYIPHQIHQLPKNYEEIPLSSQFNYKGYCYISANEINWNANKQSRITLNKAIGGLQTK
tara:strand:- start:246 stop:476 length:231 start_codon:yes stop_codon:yes gene_type:complete